MDKSQLATYLVNLHTLMEAQSKGSHSIPSAALAEEYEKNWGLLKEAIRKDDHETRNRNDSNHNESGTDTSRDKSRRSGTVGHDGYLESNPTRGR